MKDRSSSVRPDAPPFTSMSSDPTMTEVVGLLLRWLSVELRTTSEPAALLSAAMLEAMVAKHGRFDLVEASMNVRGAIALELWDRGLMDPENVREAFDLRPGQSVQPARSRRALLESPIRQDREHASTDPTRHQAEEALAETRLAILLLKEAMHPGSPNPTPYKAIRRILTIVAGRLGVTAPQPMPVEKIISVTRHRVA